MNVKKIMEFALLALLCLIAVLSVACSGAGPTPTRTPRAVADNGNPTQTPWIIYVPVTVTPDPDTVTPLPTVTSSQPTARPVPPTRTPRPVAAVTTAPRATATSADTPTPAPPTNTPTPSCGQAYQVAQLLFPEDLARRDTRANAGGNSAIVFKFTPVETYPLDPKIGYMLFVQAPKNSTVRYLSHNTYIQTNQMVLDPHAVYQLTNGDSVNVTWTITVVMASGGFNDQAMTALGTIAPCGGATGPRTIYLNVMG